MSDFQDVLNQVKASDEYNETMNFNREKENNKIEFNNQKLDLEREKLKQEGNNKLIDLAVATQNKNKFDKKS